MTTNETAKPCPSSERKKSKVVVLKEVLGWAATLYRVFKATLNKFEPGTLPATSNA
jgi:hypothetical protein